MFEKFSPVSADAVSSWFVNHADREAGEAITQLKVQKLVYYADAWFLANFDKPMVNEDFQAWAHGPAIPSLYTKYRDYRWEALPEEPKQKLPKNLQSFLSAVYDEYGQFSAKKLEQMTHEESPWIDARGGLQPEAASRRIISKIKIRNYYAAKIGKEAISELPD